MYRFHFDVARGFWLIQFLKLGVIWMTVKEEQGDDMLFVNINEAEEFVKSRGIDRVYRQQAAPNTLPEWMFGGTR